MVISFLYSLENGILRRQLFFGSMKPTPLEDRGPMISLRTTMAVDDEEQANAFAAAFAFAGTV